MSAIAEVHKSDWSIQIRLSGKSILAGALADLARGYLEVHGHTQSGVAVKALSDTLNRIMESLKV